MLTGIGCASPPRARMAVTVVSSEPPSWWSPSRSVRAAQTMRPPSAASSAATSAPMPRLAPVTTTTLPSRRPMSLDGHEDAVAQLAVDRLGQVPLPPRVLDQQDLPGSDAPRLPVAGRDLHAGVEVDDVLSTRRGVPVQIVVGLDLAEDDPAGRQARGQASGPARLDVRDLDVLEVRFALLVDVKPVYLHGCRS